MIFVLELEWKEFYIYIYPIPFFAAYQACMSGEGVRRQYLHLSCESCQGRGIIAIFNQYHYHRYQRDLPGRRISHC